MGEGPLGARPSDEEEAWAHADEDPLAAGGVERVDAALRWRLVLGRYAEAHLPLEGEGAPGEAGGEAGGRQGSGDLADRMAEAARVDRSLQFVYDREHARRAHRRVGGGDGDGLTVPHWLSGVRELFPEDAVHVIERDALVRYGMTELVTDPEVLRRARPTPELVHAILQFKHLMQPEVLAVARGLVQQVVAELSARIEAGVAPALRGRAGQAAVPPRRTWRNVDWHRTIRSNLRRYDPQTERLVPDRIRFRHRQRDRQRWRIIVAVDQSGSMLDSLIHSAILAAIFADLPAVEVHLILWDHRVVDVSHIAHDPLEVLMGAQLGGGTLLLPALQHCASLITEPERTILAVLSDFYIWENQEACQALARDLAAAGVHGFGLCALDERGRAVYDERFARGLADAGWLVAALTPRKLADLVAQRIG